MTKGLLFGTSSRVELLGLNIQMTLLTEIVVFPASLSYQMTDLFPIFNKKEELINLQNSLT